MVKDYTHHVARSGSWLDPTEVESVGEGGSRPSCWANPGLLTAALYQGWSWWENRRPVRQLFTALYWGLGLEHSLKSAPPLLWTEGTTSLGAQRRRDVCIVDHEKTICPSSEAFPTLPSPLTLSVQLIFPPHASPAVPPLDTGPLRWGAGKIDGAQRKRGGTNRCYCCRYLEFQLSHSLRVTAVSKQVRNQSIKMQAWSCSDQMFMLCDLLLALTLGHWACSRTAYLQMHVIQPPLHNRVCCEHNYKGIVSINGNVCVLPGNPVSSVLRKQIVHKSAFMCKNCTSQLNYIFWIKNTFTLLVIVICYSTLWGESFAAWNEWEASLPIADWLCKTSTAGAAALCRSQALGWAFWTRTLPCSWNHSPASHWLTSSKSWGEVCVQVLTAGLRRPPTGSLAPSVGKRGGRETDHLKNHHIF